MREKKIEVRTALSKDKKAIMDLWRYSFADTQSFVEYYFAERFLEENTIGLFSDDYLEAALQLNPYNLVINDVVTEVKYVVGVCVQPESRGLGYMTELISETLNMQYRDEEEFSILMPIDSRIYERYGYANCFSRHEFLMDLDRITPIKTGYRIKRIDPVNSENAERDIHNLSQIYYDIVSGNFSFISRNSRYWKNKMMELAIDGGQLFVVYHEKEPRGYAMIIAKTSDGIGNVVEMAFTDEEAYHTLMGLIKSHITQFQRVRINTPQVEEFTIMSGFDNKIEHRVQPFMMGRVINAEKVLDTILYKARLFKGERKGYGNIEEVAIEVTDAFIEQNNLLFIYKNGNVEQIVRANQQIPEDAIPKIKLTMSVAELAQLYLKSVSLRMLFQMGKVSTNPEHLHFFEEVFGTEVCSNYVNDYI